MMKHSRIRKNDEVAGALAWKCPKLRRVDYWEEGVEKVVVLLRERKHGHGYGDESGRGRRGGRFGGFVGGLLVEVGVWRISCGYRIRV